MDPEETIARKTVPKKRKHRKHRSEMIFKSTTEPETVSTKKYWKPKKLRKCYGVRLYMGPNRGIYARRRGRKIYLPTRK